MRTNLITKISLSYPKTRGDFPASLSHAELPKNDLVNWFASPRGLIFRHADVEDAINHLDLHASWPDRDHLPLNAIEIGLKTEAQGSYQDFDDFGALIATLFFVDPNKFVLCTPMRSDVACRRIAAIAEDYIHKLAARMEDPIQADELSFLTQE